MKKILMAGFYHESNTFNPILTQKEDFLSVTGQELLDYFPGAVGAFEKAGYEIITSWFSGMMSTGVIEEEAYRFYVNRIIEDICAHKNEISGIWLMLHGSIYAENIGSGELFMLRKIRKEIGYDMPVAVAMDPHSNLSPDITKYANILRAYHTAPHIDQQDTYRVSAEALIDFIERGVKITPAFYRLPMLLCGDTALTRDEPLKSVIARFKEMEAGDKYACASFHISMHSANTENTYPSVTIVPRDMKDYDEAFALAKEIAHYIYDRRDAFHFEGTLLKMDEAVDSALKAEKLPVILSDSGDNTTAGATGMNTEMLKAFMERGKLGRKVLISTIWDKKCFEYLDQFMIGDEVEADLGSGIDANSQPVHIKGRIKAKGNTLLSLAIRKEGDISPISRIITVDMGDIDVSITPIPDSLTDMDQFDAAGLNPKEYDIIVIKQSYQFPDMVHMAGTQIIALTPGATYQELDKLYYSKLPWTLWPFCQ